MKVKFVNEKDLPKGYGGINYYAAKELGIKFPYDRSTILIVGGQDAASTKAVIQHEIIECDIMKSGKIKYLEAHQITNSIQYHLRNIEEMKYDV